MEKKEISVKMEKKETSVKMETKEISVRMPGSGTIAQEHGITSDLSIAIVNAYEPHIESVAKAHEELSRVYGGSPDDKESYAEAKKAQRSAASVRVQLDNARKGLKENILKMGKAVDSIYKAIIEPLVEQEARVKGEIAQSDAILEDRKIVKEREKFLPLRIETLQAMAVPVPERETLMLMTNDDFNGYIRVELTKRAQAAEAEAEKVKEEKKRLEDEVLKEMEIEERAKRKAEQFLREKEMAASPEKPSELDPEPEAEPEPEKEPEKEVVWAKARATIIEEWPGIDEASEASEVGENDYTQSFNAYIDKLLSVNAGTYPEHSQEHQKIEAIKGYLERYKQ